MSTADLFAKRAPELFPKQKERVEFLLERPRAYDASDPGTGKTAVELVAYNREADTGRAKKALVLATKSILKPAWGNDIAKFLPGATYSIARAENRAEAFKADANVYITNHDAVKWLAKQPTSFFDGFTDLIIDEATAFKHRTSQRSKALAAIVKHFERRRELSGTPFTNTILDLWHQYLLLDDGERLGDNFWKFRQVACEPVQVGPGAKMVNWADREGIVEAVMDRVGDITIRHPYERTYNNVTRFIEYELPTKHRRAYELLRDEAVLLLECGDITALNRGALKQKLLQLASGAVYDGDRIAQIIDTGRYELIMDLVEERKHSIVAFAWTHQRDELIKLAKKRKITYGLIDGSVTDDRVRDRCVEEFQAGKLQVMFCHPQSAGHGLTLTRGIATIWASPTHNLEHYLQYNRRIDRTGQTQDIETIHVEAPGTLERGVYHDLEGKNSRLGDGLDLLELLRDAA
jgi:SNF2 family DNA or RNA helicase